MTVTIGRRELLAALGGAAVAWPLVARAQQPSGMRRVSVIYALDAGDTEAEARNRVLEQGSARFGLDSRPRPED